MPSLFHKDLASCVESVGAWGAWGGEVKMCYNLCFNGWSLGFLTRILRPRWWWLVGWRTRPWTLTGLWVNRSAENQRFWFLVHSLVTLPLSWEISGSVWILDCGLWCIDIKLGPLASRFDKVPFTAIGTNYEDGLSSSCWNEEETIWDFPILIVGTCWCFCLS